MSKIFAFKRTLLCGLVPLALGAAVPQDQAYRAAMDNWRRAREATVSAEDGWLAVAGLFWLKPGRNRFGTDRSNDIVLPAGSAPPHAGTFVLSGDLTTVEAGPGVRLAVNGSELRAGVRPVPLRADSSGTPDMMSVGRVTMSVIVRGGRHGVRLRDPDSERRRSFRGLQWFPVDETYRVTARFIPAAPGKTLSIVNVLGQQQQMSSAGTATFRIDGRTCHLEPVLEGPGSRQLFFIFRDATTGRGTYPGGRFLYTDLPRNGEVVLDFNKAENPPCAYTAFATCPLPPKQNSLAVAIEAGEKYQRH
jgi:hypothetical protein